MGQPECTVEGRTTPFWPAINVLTTSQEEQDQVSAYVQHPAGYSVKSNVSREFLEVVSLLECSWRIVELPGDLEAARCRTG